MSDYNWSCTHCEAQTQDGFMVLRENEIFKIFTSGEVSKKETRVLYWEELESLSENQAKWEVQCPACSIFVPDDGYVFTLDRIDTHAKALEWTLHLLDRGYSGSSTNWSAILRSSSVERISA
jgi:hypothetical protein